MTKPPIFRAFGHALLQFVDTSLMRMISLIRAWRCTDQFIGGPRLASFRHPSLRDPNQLAKLCVPRTNVGAHIGRAE